MAKKPINHIIIKGAKTHNLKNINLTIPKKKIIVLTGVSGSGKSSLAFDTLFAEGQRRYIESMSSYARQFLGKLKKPEVQEITGISPAISVEQKVSIKNPRSTIGTSTEIYDYLKLLFSRIGKTFSPISHKEVICHTVSDVINFICTKPKETKIFILTNNYRQQDSKDYLESILKQGFSRVKINNKIERIDTILKTNPNLTKKEILLVIDRLSASQDKENLARMAESIQSAFYEGEGKCLIQIAEEELKVFSNKFESDDIVFEKPSDELFSFNNPYGACKKCQGFGNVMGIDESKVIKNQDLSIYDGAVHCWKGETLSKWKDRFISESYEYDFPVHRSYINLTTEEKGLLWNGSKKLKGIYYFFEKLEKKKYKIQNRVMLARYRGKSRCPDCQGGRLRKEAFWVKINNKTIHDIVTLSISEALCFFKTIKLNEHDYEIGKRLIKEIVERLHFIKEVGLEYLTLNRLSSTLSGGESQRINLAKSISSSLVGAMYILDEPSVGLHPRDTKKLIEMLSNLKNCGNTVIIVEHDEDIIKSADQIIDIGPNAGIDGGQIIYQGDIQNINKSKKSLTGQYLNKKLDIKIPKNRRTWSKSISLKGALENNLKNINVTFPLNTLISITGVSGSGKSSLITKTLLPAIEKKINGYTNYIGKHKSLEGNLNEIEKIEFVNQNPIGRSSRSNPATYMKAYDEIRNLFSNQKLAKSRGYKSGHFSFNTDGGRCESCKGEGFITIEMQFMSDVYLLCDSCNGNRFKKETLEITFQNKNISEILELTVSEAINFFKSYKQDRIATKLLPLERVGLGYVNLGQSSNTLSGGEAQRIKLASFLSKGTNNKKTLFIFDEPTTGLHFHDINKLMQSFNALIKNGHSIICIEHNLDIIKCSDWIIDLGPSGGRNGGEVIFEGTPEDLIKCKKSYTGKHLKMKL